MSATTTRVMPFAMSEDEPIIWYEGTVSARDARRQFRSDMADVKPWWRVHARREHMRVATQADCPAAEHAETADSDRPENCTCSFYEEEGWRFECKPDHPHAVAVWRVEERRPPAWWFAFRRGIQRLHPDAQRGYRRPAPLWGARVQRRANRFDQLLLGRGRIYVLGDLCLRLRMEEIRFCKTCELPTLHTCGRHAPMCLADRHTERQFAAIKESM